MRTVTQLQPGIEGFATYPIARNMFVTKVNGSHPDVIIRGKVIKEQLQELTDIFNDDTIALNFHPRASIESRYLLSCYNGRITLDIDIGITKRKYPAILKEMNTLTTALGSWYTEFKDKARYYPSPESWKTKVDGDFGLAYGCVITSPRPHKMVDPELITYCANNIRAQVRTYNPDSYDEAHLDCLGREVDNKGFYLESNGCYLIPTEHFCTATLIEIANKVDTWVETIDYWSERTLANAIQWHV